MDEHNIVLIGKKAEALSLLMDWSRKQLVAVYANEHMINMIMKHVDRIITGKLAEWPGNDEGIAEFIEVYKVEFIATLTQMGPPPHPTKE